MLQGESARLKCFALPFFVSITKSYPFYDFYVFYFTSVNAYIKDVNILYHVGGLHNE